MIIVSETKVEAKNSKGCICSGVYVKTSAALHVRIVVRTCNEAPTKFSQRGSKQEREKV
jgi:hypothetical protein